MVAAPVLPTGVGRFLSRWWFFVSERRGTPIKRSSSSTRDSRALLNEEIRATPVRLVGADGKQVGIVSRDAALAQAKMAGLDLVLIAPDSNPPVVKVLDYGKHLFELKKARASQRKKQKQIQVKEMKFRPTTDTGDYLIKLRKLREFLEGGDKIKINMRFRGRELAHPELGQRMLRRLETDLSDLGTVETSTTLEGRQMTMVMGPNKKKR